MPPTSYPLGISFPPHDIHAISVSMPKWEHVIGYEEGDSKILNVMVCGYPRFFRHPAVVALETATQTHLFPNDDINKWEVMIVPTFDVAKRLQSFLVMSNSDSTKPDEVTIHTFKNIIYAVRYRHHVKSTAKAYWQHTGEIISSRHATHLMQLFQNNQEFQPQAIRDSKHHLRLQQRIAELYLSLNDPKKVALYATGMSAIFASVRLLQTLKGRNVKSVLIGFPYVDTLKILSRNEWCPQGVYFFPTCGEHEMKEIEKILKNEKILGIWTEFPSNPLLSMADLKQLAQHAHENGTLLVVDDTIGSYNINPMKHECADVVVTSLSKIFSGSSNVMGGSLVLNPMSSMIQELETNLNVQNDSFLFEDDVLILLEQSQTLNQRLAKTNATTFEIVKKMENHPLVKDVFYPTRGDVKHLFDPFVKESVEKEKPHFGPLFSIVLHGGCEPAKAFYDALTCAKGPSLGTNFTLACPYSLLAHYVELDLIESYGVDRNLIRISIGQEDCEILWANFKHALDVASTTVSTSN
ncbi:cystathionine gamma-synthase [Plasmopara halstedii]|uniref:Cystathionine gamma-synthase n=1 Tax=Plasmopara halstedii TaxID=4781 RepID=A0A0P1AGN7_PLAHL|nr:cystathionine gamma-synthase [Plasmopara halstedii]CEG40231.1 cystathionine gamma-synthase [Plasmopara halstedii]|eukprot:XP_024576600.1 cystathionine gamma-synthase [Plasmopara halstedii]